MALLNCCFPPPHPTPVHTKTLEMKVDGRSCCDRESRRGWFRIQTGMLLDRDELLVVVGTWRVVVGTWRVVVVAIVKRVVGTCPFGAVDPSRYIVESRR